MSTSALRVPGLRVWIEVADKIFLFSVSEIDLEGMLIAADPICRLFFPMGEVIATTVTTLEHGGPGLLTANARVLRFERRSIAVTWQGPYHAMVGEFLARLGSHAMVDGIVCDASAGHVRSSGA